MIKRSGFCKPRCKRYLFLYQFKQALVANERQLVTNHQTIFGSLYASKQRKNCINSYLKSETLKGFKFRRALKNYAKSKTFAQRLNEDFGERGISLRARIANPRDRGYCNLLSAYIQENLYILKSFHNARFSWS